MNYDINLDLIFNNIKTEENEKFYYSTTPISFMLEEEVYNQYGKVSHVKITEDILKENKNLTINKAMRKELK